jgi:protease-4
MADPTPPLPPTLLTPRPPELPPVRRPPRPERRGYGCLLPTLLVLLLGSVMLNLVLGALVATFSDRAEPEAEKLDERFLLGDKDADDKVAVIRLSGVIAESTTAYPIKQLEKAAKDKHVRAVVLRIDSPGGTVTASEELYQCVVNLRDDTGRRFKGSGPKPVAVSMGAVAASGGYYVAAAGKPISAEPTTITGSIGVFAALPNVSGLLHNNGVRVELIKAGAIKGSGSFFHDLSQEERQTWQDTVDNAYDIFLKRISEGRPLTPDQLRNEKVIDKQVPRRNEKGNLANEKDEPLPPGAAPVMVPYTRVRADGGTFTAEEAVKFKLADKVEDLPAAIRAAAAAAGMGSFKAVVYDRPTSLLDVLTGGRVSVQKPLPDVESLTSSLTPRLWYLTPSADGALLTPSR